MRNFLASRTGRAVAGVSTFVGVVMAPALALAVTPSYDLAPISTGFTDQIQAALVVALPIAAGLIALSVGIVWVKKLLKAH
jgi:hypothetical protein